MRHLMWSMVVAVGLCACGGSKAPANAPLPAGAPTLEKSKDSGKVDKIGTQDGELSPDGTNDLGFVTKVDGPVAAVFLVLVDGSDAPTGGYQADTLVGNAESPKELGGKAGMVTAGLGVFEGDKLLNATDGSLPALAAGPHTLTLYVTPLPMLTPGTRLRVYVLRPDKSLLGGQTITN